MRPFYPRRVKALSALAAVIALALGLSGASAPRKRKSEPPPPKVNETVGDVAYIPMKGELKLEGVGLVVGLDNAGVNAPTSWYRQKLLDEMRKEGVENANKILNDPGVAMVIVRVTAQPGVSPSDRLDVEIELPPACTLKDPGLSGGYLLRCRLRETMVLGGSPKEGPEMGFAQGPVMIGNAQDPSDNKVGRILGGGRIKKEMPFQLLLRDNRRSFRVSAMVEGVVNQRFPQTRGVDQKGAAVAKTDGLLTLNIPPVYHQNQPRFFEVVKLLPMVDDPALREERLAQWGRELLDPTTTGRAALKLEGLGVGASPVLRTGLASTNAQVRFFAAEALAYLNDPAGVEALGETVIKQPEFRAYALAALAAMDEPAAHVKLRKMMDESDPLVRYGAFNALRTSESDDPYLGRVRVIDRPEEKDEDDSVDSMAVAITRASRKRRPNDPFALYLVDSEGPPMLHISGTKRCEIVLFGRGQKLQTPVVLGSGPILMNASDGDRAVQISKILPSRFGDADAKVQASLELGDVIRRAANLGATYPEIVAMLQAAERQKNLPGPLLIDAVPAANPVYTQAELLGKDTTIKKDDALQKTGLESGGSRSKRPSLLEWLRRSRKK